MEPLNDGSEHEGAIAFVPTQRHDTLYFNDYTVIFKVENTLFKVHQYFLKQHSKVFSTMFSLPPADGKPEEGQSDENPIYLEDVSCVDFERLLSLFYPANPESGDLSTVAEWTSVLALATKWEFNLHRDLAISRLAQLASPIDRILLARRFDIVGWLAPAYVDLCKRDDPLTLDEGMKLGMRDVILLSDIRQSIRGNYRVTMQDRNISALIDKKLV